MNVGVAGNPDSAMIAARGYAGVSIISDAAQIGRLPLTLLDLSPSHLETLNLWGITTLGGLAALDAKALSQRLGQQGVQLQKLAHGQQVNPFLADEEQIEFRERSELESPIDLLDSLSFVSLPCWNGSAPNWPNTVWQPMKSIANLLLIRLGSREKTCQRISFSIAGPSGCPIPPPIALCCCVSCNSICRRIRLARPC